ncbi:hypothetical protein Tco_0505563 [Tanacetum coccineum]
MVVYYVINGLVLLRLFMEWMQVSILWDISTYSMLHGRNTLPINTLSRKVGNGSSIRFWKDPWNGNGILMTKFNRLYHLDANADCFLSYRRVNNSWVWDWKRQVLGSRNEATLEDLVSVLGQCNFLTSLMHGLGFLTTTMFLQFMQLEFILTLASFLISKYSMVQNATS